MFEFLQCLKTDVERTCIINHFSEEIPKYLSAIRFAVAWQSQWKLVEMLEIIGIYFYLRKKRKVLSSCEISKAVSWNIFEWCENLILFGGNNISEISSFSSR